MHKNYTNAESNNSFTKPITFFLSNHCIRKVYYKLQTHFKQFTHTPIIGPFK